MSLTLVILAAGMGSRYGGLKQLDPVGPSGETILDYAVFDAARAGFDRVVFVIRRDFAGEFERVVVRRYAAWLPVELVFQATDLVPAGVSVSPERTKPWGTGHALWCARAAVPGPFAVINADDFYGRDAFGQLAQLLRQPATAARKPRFGIVGYRLDQTLSEHGAVSRGICTVSSDGLLQKVEERTGIRREDIGPGRTYTGAETVSMNCWGMTRVVFGQLEWQLTAFLQQHGHDPKAEFYLPAAISDLVAGDAAEVAVLSTSARWFGVTYREDRPRVAAALAELIAAGEYPADLRAVNLASTT